MSDRTPSEPATSPDAPARRSRRDFLQVSSLAGGGLLLGFNWLAGCKPEAASPLAEAAAALPPPDWHAINGFLSVATDGQVTIMSPNPEIGQNVKTSMPMIVAEELDCDWASVRVEQAPLNTDIFKNQIAGGSQSIRRGWPALRRAGATARQMLREAAAEAWGVPVAEVTTAAGQLHHAPSGKTAGYGNFAAAAAEREAPEEVALKPNGEFRIVGTSRGNVDALAIVTGKPLYGLDTREAGMLYAVIAAPPAFGMRLARVVDDSAARAVPGVRDVVVFDSYEDGYAEQWCDTTAFRRLVAVVADSTWQALRGREALELAWEEAPEQEAELAFFGRTITRTTPAGLENTPAQEARMERLSILPPDRDARARDDGDVDAALAGAATVIERTYTAPFLAHNTLEPMNFFADVTAERARLVGPVQTPEYMEQSVATRLGLEPEQVTIEMTRMGGGFGRRLYGHFLVEAAVISRAVGAPVQLTYTREDDMAFGCYRPAYHARYRAGLDADGELVAWHVRAGGIPESPLAAHRFPAGAVANYRAEQWESPTNVSTGAWRAPRSNFIAGAEQAFLDEVAEAAGADPIEFRLRLLRRAAEDPVGDPEGNDYDPARYAGVLELARAHAGPAPTGEGVGRGVSAYFCHNSYVANVLDLRVTPDGKPLVDRVLACVDCGIVVNPDAAKNMVEGGTVDGIGHALYSALTLRDGRPEQRNFDTYRLIRHEEAPREIEVHFVDNGIDPTGLGEPPFPPVIGAVANALYGATGRRFYHQPFAGELGVREGVEG